MSSADLIKPAQVREARRPDLAPVRPLAPVAHHIDAHLALGRLNRAVRLPRRDSVPLGEQQEMMNQRFHILFHRGARRRGNLVILDLDGTRGHLIQALVNDAEGLTEFFHAAEVAIVAVAVDADGDVEVDAVVGVVGGGFAHVPRHAGATEHDAGEGEVERLGRAHLADALGAPFPYAVVGQELFGFVDAVAELRRPLVDVVQEAEGNVLRDAAGADVRGVEPGAGDALVEFHELFPLFETPEEWRQRTDVHGVGEDRHEVVEDAGDLAEQGANPFGALGHFDVEQFFDGEGETLFVCHHGDVVEAVKVGERLEVGFVFDQFLRATVQETDVWIRTYDLFAVELKNET